MKAPAPFEDGPEFRHLIRGDAEVDLARLALELARDADPNLDARPYLARLDELAARVRERCRPGAPPGAVIGQINWVLYVEERFRGNVDDYDDPRNSYLNEVMERRLGIPISLSVLYAAVAARAGLAMEGVNLPCHFVLRTGAGSAPLFVDPFHQGAVLDRDGCRRRVDEVSGGTVGVSDEHLAPCSTATVVARMLRNLKRIYLERGEFHSALPVQGRLSALLPDDVWERRDLGVIAVRAGHPGQAIDPLRRYLDARPLADDSATISAFLKAALREVATWN